MRANEFFRKTLKVVEVILKNRNKLSVLFDCYLSYDDTVCLRVSSAFNWIFRHDRVWFIEYIDKFQTLIPNLKQPSADWILSQLHLEMKDLLSESQKNIAVNITKKQLDESNDWIVIIKSMKYIMLMEFLEVH